MSTSYIDHVWEILTYNSNNFDSVPSRDLVERVLSIVHEDMLEENVRVDQLTR
jgi:hypothetical protein